MVWRMCRLVSSMKFSYRVVALLMLVVTLAVVYLTWGENLVSGEDRNQTRKASGGLLGSSLLGRASLNSSWDPWASSAARGGTPPHQVGVPKRGPPRVAKATCAYDKFEGARRDVGTFQLLEEVARSMGRKGLGGRIPKEGLPQDDGGPYKRLPLKVIVVPHSHNDPGWHKTVDGYFEDQTKPTLDNMVEKLMKYPTMTFIWAESVFLRMWWETLDLSRKQAVRGLIQNGQLEIVVGSWVVPDEANPHYFALVDQMIEGHQWLESELGVKPRNTWSLDPFGYSSTLPYLYRRAGYDNMVILRTHRLVKSLLEQRMSLEFSWRQSWDRGGSGGTGGDTDIFTQMMPYKLYNIKHTCGPDQDVCLKFDFRKIPGETSEARPESVGANNAARLSELLLSEYLKKASLFRHNVILIPIGDDFRFDRPVEWDQQFGNYSLLFEYLNGHPELNVQARFGTIQDYFREVRKEAEALNTTVERMFPTLTGDFFPYTDEREEYWTGYYTSRPFDKLLGRELEVQLRAAEVVHSLAMASRRAAYDAEAEAAQALSLLRTARQDLGLFQHHDAITGTARSYVVLDYEQRLKVAISNVRDVFRGALRHLIRDPRATATQSGASDVTLEVDSPMAYKLAKPLTTAFAVPKGGGFNVVLFNPVAQGRREVVRLTLTAAHVAVFSDKNKPVTCQVNPLWVAEGVPSGAHFELVFTAVLPALGSVVYTVGDAKPSAATRCQLASVELYNLPAAAAAAAAAGAAPKAPPPVFSIKQHSGDDGGEPLVLENRHIRAEFSTTDGFLQSVADVPDPLGGGGGTGGGGKTQTKTRIRFLLYETVHSGAYIFKPEGNATGREFLLRPAVCVLRGPVESAVHSLQPLVNHTARLYHGAVPAARALELVNVVNLTKLSNVEMIVRVATDVDNLNRTFFTDLNGFQVARRRAFPNFPPEANYYPMTSFLFLEDRRARLSLVSAQPLGVSSQGPGQMEVMLDRRLRYDDGRGLGEGVMDNKLTPSRFYLLLERPVTTLTADRLAFKARREVAFPSLLAHSLADSLRHYPISAVVRGGDKNIVLRHEPIAGELPCDVTLVNLRCLEADSSRDAAHRAAAILHRVGTDCDFDAPGMHCAAGGPQSAALSLEELFDSDSKTVTQVEEKSLSLMHSKRVLATKERVKLDLMHLYAFVLSFS